MDMSSIKSGPHPGESPSSFDAATLATRIDKLTERQRIYLRLVRQLKNSKEIAAIAGNTSPRGVDKQLLKANAILGVSKRFDAAQMLAAYEQGVEYSSPANALPSVPSDFRLSRPWPTAGAAANMLTWKQAASWTAIISIVTPIGLTAAGMAFLTLLLLLRLRPW